MNLFIGVQSIDSKMVKGFPLFNERDAGDLDERATKFSEVTVTLSVGVIPALIDCLMGRGSGYAWSRAYNILAKYGINNDLEGAIVRSVSYGSLPGFNMVAGDIDIPACMVTAEFYR